VVANDRDTAWTYSINLDSPPDEAPALEPSISSPRKRPWDLNRDMTRAVERPGKEHALLWRFPGTQSVNYLSTPGTKLRGLAFSPDGKWVIGLCDESRLRKWDASTGSLEGTPVRLASRPEWSSDTETADLTFDKDFTRVTVKTDYFTSTWSLDDGRMLLPSKKVSEGMPLKDKYRLKAESAGRGTFSAFHDDFTLRAKLLQLPGGELDSWCLTDDRTTLAAASHRQITVWRIRYP
jgi:WD40 repeat protein